MTEVGPPRPLTLRFVALNHGPDTLGNAPLTTALTRGLAALGHRVEVLTAWPHHDLSRVAPGAWRTLGRHREHGVRVVRVPVPAPESTPLGRAATHAAFVAWALAAGRVSTFGAADGKHPLDAQIVPLPPLSAGWAGAPGKAPVVLDVQDVFPLNLSHLAAQHPRLGPPALGAAAWLARRGYRHAAHLRCLGPAAAAALARLGANADHVTAIPNPARLDGLSPEGPHSLRATLSPDGGPVALVSGRLGAALDLATLARAWPQVLARWPAAAGPQPWLALVGAGPAAKAAERLASALPRTRFLTLQPIEMLGDLLRSCAVGLVPLRAHAAAASLPSRTLSLWASGRPVVLAAEAHTDAAAQVHAAGGGAVVPPDDAEALAVALLKRLAEPARAAAEGRAGSAWVQAHATPARVAEAWSRLLWRVVTARAVR